MAAHEPTFTDWVQVEADRHRPLLVDDDFSWLEPPAPRRRVGAVVVGDRWLQDDDGWLVDDSDLAADDRVSEDLQQAAVQRAPGADADADMDPAPVATDASLATTDVCEQGESFGPAEAPEDASFELDDAVAVDQSGRRTIVIRGRGAERYAVTPRRNRDAGLSFHERPGFTPDRTAKWAVLMGVALLLGCIIH